MLVLIPFLFIILAIIFIILQKLDLRLEDIYNKIKEKRIIHTCPNCNRKTVLTKKMINIYKKDSSYDNGIFLCHHCAEPVILSFSDLVFFKYFPDCIGNIIDTDITKLEDVVYYTKCNNCNIYILFKSCDIHLDITNGYYIYCINDGNKIFINKVNSHILYSSMEIKECISEYKTLYFKNYKY